MTIKIGEFPFISLLLAFSFGIYGLLKKIVHIDAISSITIECIVTAPAGFNLCYLPMAATTHNIWIKYIIILATIFRCNYSNTIDSVLSRC